MNLFGWAMMALGLFLVLYTVAFLVRPQGEKGKNTLGCGFVIAAGLVWSIALTQYVGSSSAGVRLGFGAALVLPALATLFKGGKRIVPAAISFVLAILIASSAIPSLKERIRPSEARTEAIDIAKQVETIRLQIEKREAQLNSLRAAESRLKGELKALSVSDFDAAMANPEAKRIIEELAEVKRLRSGAEPKLQREQAALKKLESELRRAKRRAEADALGDDIDTDALTEILDEEDITSPSTVEDYAEREAMRALFEESK